MVIGTDGNMWYVSNGLDLGDPCSKYSFEPTLEQAIEAYNRDHVKQNEICVECPDGLHKYLNASTAEYRKNNPFGATGEIQ